MLPPLPTPEEPSTSPAATTTPPPCVPAAPELEDCRTTVPPSLSGSVRELPAALRRSTAPVGSLYNERLLRGLQITLRPVIESVSGVPVSTTLILSATESRASGVCTPMPNRPETVVSPNSQLTLLPASTEASPPVTRESD